jgi:spore coat protein CotH
VEPGLLVEDEPSAKIYSPGRVPRFELEIAPEDFESLENRARSYVPATFRHGDIVLHDVGVRLKGNFTFRRIDQKPSFKIKFDKYVRGQRFHGLRRMTLHNSIVDYSFMAERLGYSVFRNAGLPAPRVNNAEVHVNGQLYGLYVNVETIDKIFLKRWFASNDGNLYEMEDSVSWTPGNEDAFDLETNEELNDRSDLEALLAAVTEARDESLLEDVAHILDPELFLRYCAIEGIVNQWDGFAYNAWLRPNNYRLYHRPSTGTFVLLPWSMDNSLKINRTRMYLDLYTTTRYILESCLGSESCKAEYERVLADEAARFESMNLVDTAHGIHDQIAELVDRDPRKEHSVADFEETFDEVLLFLQSRPDNVRQQVAQH